MSTIFRNVVVLIPEGARISKTDGRVVIVTEKRYLPDRHYNMDQRKTIGLAIDESRMYPNSFFRWKFPEIFAENAKEKLPVHTKSIGLYAASLALAKRTGLYQILIGSFGIESANMIMDYAIYSILQKSNVSEHYSNVMKSQMLFSEERKDDTWISSFFKDSMTESMVADFKKEWARKCTGNGVTRVWISIDGSNSDNNTEEAAISEPGHAKSGKNASVISYMYAVNADDGMPIFYTVYRGGRIDGKELSEIIAYLQAYGVKIEGVILDRGFCSADNILLLKEAGLRYIVMLRQNTYGYRSMADQYGTTIKDSWEYSLDAYGMYGKTEKCRIFGDSKEEGYISLYCDSVNGSSRRASFVNKIRTLCKELQKELRAGKDPQIPNEFVRYLSVKKNGEMVTIEVNEKEIQTSMNHKGLSAIASSEATTADEVNSRYHLRDASEKQFMVLKTQLGGDVLRSHTENGIRSRFAVAFVAGILRNEIQKTAIAVEMPANVAIQELNLLEMHLMQENIYTYVHTENNRQIKLLAAFGLALDDLEYIVSQENKRMREAIHSPFHDLPEHGAVTQQRKISKRAGRPKGSKNKAK